MKYLKFIAKRKIDPDFKHIIDFDYVFGNSLERLSKHIIEDLNIIRIGMTGREVPHLKMEVEKFGLEPIYFTIARNYLIEKISNDEEIQKKEELLLDAENYLFNDYETFYLFNTDLLEIQ